MTILPFLQPAWWIAHRHRWTLLQILLIILAGTAAYSNTLQVQLVMDDYPAISLYGPQDITEILLHGTARRVTDATLAFNYHLHGLQVTGYHLVNLAIHLAASVTFYFVVVSALAALRISFAASEDTKSQTGFAERFVPCAAALLFAVHPLQTQAVTYIVQRYTSLATLFYLLSVLFFLKARLASIHRDRLLYPLLLGISSVAAGILAVGSKQIAVTLPFMLIILELYLFRGQLLRRRFYILCGVITITSLAIVLTVWHPHSLHEFLESLHNATSENHYMPRSTYFLTQTRIVATYLRLLFLPLGQSLFHDYHIFSSLFSWMVIASLALHFSLVIMAVVLFRASERRLISGDHLPGTLQRLASLGIAWFYIAMAVESSFFPITDIIFEHRIYLPSVGFLLTVTAGTALATCSSRTGNRIAWSLLTVACLILGGLTYARNRIWSNTLVLWQDTVKKSPAKDLALANLAGEYMKLDMPEKALPIYVRALELSQIFMETTKVHLGLTLQRLNIDGSLFTTGEEILPIRDLKGRVTLTRKDKERLQGIMYNNLGLAREYLGDPVKAKEHYRAALIVNPGYDLAWYNLGILSARLGDIQQAASARQQLQKINPTMAEGLAKALPQ